MRLSCWRGCYRYCRRCLSGRACQLLDVQHVFPQCGWSDRAKRKAFFSFNLISGGSRPTKAPARQYTRGDVTPGSRPSRSERARLCAQLCLNTAGLRFRIIPGGRPQLWNRGTRTPRHGYPKWLVASPFWPVHSGLIASHLGQIRWVMPDRTERKTNSKSLLADWLRSELGTRVVPAIRVGTAFAKPGGDIRREAGRRNRFSSRKR